MAQHGRRHGNYHGAETIIGPQVFPDPGGAVILRWDGSHANAWYLVYRGKTKVAATQSPSFQGAVRTDRAEVFQIFEAGPKNALEAVQDAMLIVAVPGDLVSLEWTRPVSGDPVEYRIYWDAGTGTMDYADGHDIGRVEDTGAATYSWESGYLAADTYKFVVRARDEAGNEEANTTIVTLTVAPLPKPPSNLAFSFNNATHILTMTWTASPTAGATYRIHTNGGSGWIDYATVFDTEATTTWVYDMTGLTGDYTFGMRSWDGVNDDGNASLIIRVKVAAGILANVPNAPQGLQADAVAGGKIRLEWSYARTIPQVESGACNHFHVYYDNGTGTVNYGAAIGTVAMSSGVLSFTSAALTHGVAYQFGVRASTSGSAEENNTLTASATADTTAPAAVTGLAGEVTY